MPEHHERREYNIRMAEDIGAIKAMLEGLSGPQGRITKLEEDAKWQDTKQWLHTCVIVPVVSAAHIVAHKLGL